MARIELAGPSLLYPRKKSMRPRHFTGRRAGRTRVGRWQLEAALRRKIASGWRGLALAPSGGSVTRHGYHCRGQLGSVHGKPGAVGRQNPTLAPRTVCGSRLGGGIEKMFTRAPEPNVRIQMGWTPSATAKPASDRI